MQVLSLQDSTVPDGALRINLDGQFSLPGYVNAVQAYPLALPDWAKVAPHSTATIRASHVLQTLADPAAAVKQWAAALKPGGTLQIAVPDLKLAAQAVAEGRSHGISPGLTLEHLAKLMRDAGLSGLKRWTSTVNDAAAAPGSLNLEGTKPAAVGIMSAPRLGFLDNCDSLLALAACGIPMRRVYGAFWQKSLTLALEAVIEQGHEFAIVTDYDSTFAPEDALGLVEQLKAHPEAGAIAGVQVQRGCNNSLLKMLDADGKPRGDVRMDEFRPDLTEVGMTHFGLTAIRLDAVASMPRPWLTFQFDEHGSYGPDSIDPDVYFWNSMRASGWKLYQSNRVTVAHMQLMRSWPGQNFAPVHQYPDEYAKHGKPAGCWR